MLVLRSKNALLPFGKVHRVPGLHEYCTGAGELADVTFSRGQVRDDAARRNALQDILCVPGHQVTVVDDVSLARLELVYISFWLSSRLLENSRRENRNYSRLF